MSDTLEGIHDMAEYDAVVVGAGLLGLSTAYYIKKMNPDKRVLVVDKMGAAGQGNTAKSAAMFRSFFYSQTNLALVDTTIECFKHVQKDLGVDLKLKWVGYLWLFNNEDYRWAEPALKVMAERGLEYKVYDAHELSEKLKLRTRVTKDEDSKLMGLADVDLGILIPKAGAIDIDSLVNFYETEFKRLGGEVRYNTKVESIIVEPREPLGIPSEPYFWQDSTASGVNTDRGVIKAKKTIVAAGAWTAALLDSVGVDVHIKPRKRQLFSVRAGTDALRELLWAKGFNPEGCMPFTVLPKPRVYLKPALEENAFWFSYGDEFPRAFKLEDEPQPEENYYQYGIYQVAIKYFPQFAGSQPFTSWAGQYAMNTLDGQPVIFEENDLLVVAGASGSGNMKADAIGRIAASLYAGEEYAVLYGDKKFRVSDLSITQRRVEPEKLII